MINLKFNSLKLEGFQSLSKAEINFENLGTCFIEGINRYDTKAKSNGSGKSSLMLSIHWGLFGKTPAGIGNDVINKFYNNGCFVELHITVDNVNYIIRRSLKHKEFKTGVTILKENNDISGRNKTDSDKLIKDIIQINEDTFSQMIFLSQGFSNRFAVYTPKLRKELLEQLYNVNERLDDFIEKLKKKESSLKESIFSTEKSIVEVSTRLNMRKNEISSYQQKIESITSQIDDLMQYKSNVTESVVKELQSNLDEVQTQSNSLQEKYNKQRISLNTITSQINNQNEIIVSKKNEINKFSNNKVCPTCGTLLEDYSKNEHIQNHINELQMEINNAQNLVASLTDKYNAENEICTRMYNKMLSINARIPSLRDDLLVKTNEYFRELEKDSKISSLRENVVEYINTIENIKNIIIDDKNEIERYNSKLEINNHDLDILQHSIRLSGNQFKSYLLENIINSLNMKLKELSLSLFENEIISITGDSKLDIVLGDKIYEQLSGGEQRKVDIAIIIAQRYLAQQMNAISSNILILDEVFDGLDDISFAIVLELLSDEIQDVESTFIISHRDIKEIPFDNIITVIKDSSQVSTIKIN